MARGVKAGTTRGAYYGVWAKKTTLDIAKRVQADIGFQQSRRFKAQAQAIKDITKENVKQSALFKQLRSEFKAAGYTSQSLAVDYGNIANRRVSFLFEFTDAEIENICEAANKYIKSSIDFNNLQGNAAIMAATTLNNSPEFLAAASAVQVKSKNANLKKILSAMTGEAGIAVDYTGNVENLMISLENANEDIASLGSSVQQVYQAMDKGTKAAFKAKFKKDWKLEPLDVKVHSSKYIMIDSLIKGDTGWDPWFS